MNRLKKTHLSYWIAGLAIVSMGAAYSARTLLEIGPTATITGSFPEIQFLDTDIGDSDWEIEANGGVLQFGINGGVDEAFTISESAGEDTLNLTEDGLEANSIRHFRFLAGLNAAWDIRPDDDFFGIEFSQITDGIFDTTRPFQILENAPDESLSITDRGLEFNNILIWIEQGGTEWELAFDDDFFAVVSENSIGTFHPFVIEECVPDDSFRFVEDGELGLGTGNPDTALHLFRDGGISTALGPAQIKVEDANPAVANRDLIELVNNGGVRFALDNMDRNERWEFSNNSVGDFNISRSGTGGPEVIVSRAGRMTSGPGGFAALDSRPNGNLFIAGTLFESSDRDKKENFEDVDCDAVLKQISELEITTWNYKSDDEEIRHMGPVAQDFRASFQLGDSDKTIATTDKVGVSLAAIKALNSKLQTEVKLKDGQIEGLENELDEIKSRMNKLEAMLEQTASQR